MTVPDPVDDRRSAQHLIGIDAGALAGVGWLPDEVNLLEATVLGDGRPLIAAYVPTCLHDPSSSEAAFDDVEWAAELLASQGAGWLVVAPFLASASSEASDGILHLSPRRWNHANAMVRRLQRMGRRFGLGVTIPTTIDGRRIGRDGFNLDQPISYVLDTAGLIRRGWAPILLSAPED